MNTKLTLTIEQTVVEKAKRYARSKERSLSDLVENYLKALTVEDKSDKMETTSELNALRGAFKMQENFDYKRELSERLSEKYL